MFDFHNTLATCDAWLDLEINTLPSLSLDLLRAYGYLKNSPIHDSSQARTLFRALRQQARESGVEVSAVDGVREVLREMGYNPPLSAITEVVAELEEQCMTTLEPVEGALETLQQLHASGYKMAVVSSAGWPQFVEDALIREQMLPYFSHVLTSANEGIYKSDPEIFRRACARLNVSPANTIHIGDHARYDVQTAKAAGLHTIWFAANAHHTARLHNHDWQALQSEGNQADAIIHDLRQIPQIIQALTQQLET
ncbi:MAG: HAD family hydrolase [Chloroflexia bacterium]